MQSFFLLSVLISFFLGDTIVGRGKKIKMDVV